VPGTVVVGAQWGDEGKGKIVDLLAQDSDVVCRYQGGPNAGHTIVVDGETFKIRALPSGIVRGKPCVIGNGCVVDLEVLVGELDEFESRGRPTGEVYVSDLDGHNPQQATSDKAIVAAPTWVPGKLALCYNSYALEHNPYIFYHDLDTGKRKVIARYGGSCISPSVSPDGSKVAMVLSKGGMPNIYVANVDGSGLHQLTTDDEDSSPCWSPDGMYIYFATKVSERRTLARVSIAGGDIQRIATTGAPNPSEPDISPDGKWIAFTSQSGSYFNICVVPVAGGTPVVVTSGEDPSWAPNSRTVVFAKRSSGERYTLSVLDVFTKQAKDIARISGSDSEPAWAK